jgi:hypothetical protein
MSRELLQRALDALEECRLADYGDLTLTDEIRAELQKPEPVERGWIDTRHSILYNGWVTDNLGTGKYKLLAVRIDDDQKI